MFKEMLINTVEGQECRIAITNDGVLEELYMERASSASRVGNIYKGRITNVEAAIQAAFVDFGLGKNGFLHISDINPQYFPKKYRQTESVGHKQPRHERPPIQDCLRRGQEVIVQMTKEGIGTKGPTMTTYLSVPGRLLVMMPGMSRLGVSRKVEDEDVRAQARKQLAELKLPQDMGFIIRTAGLGRPRRDLQRDLNYLLRLWKSVKLRIQTSKAPAEIYQESDLVIRTIRDIYNADIQRIVCDNEAVARKVAEFLNMAMPRTRNTVELYTGKQGLFYDAGVEQEIEKISSRRVELKSGGSLIIDQAEALVAIDVNSGRFREHNDAEVTATKTNLEAAAEVVRQLRLRDLGGVIVIDFIDMLHDRNRRSVEKAMRDALKDDRAKTKVLRMSPFCLVEMTRQRMRPSLERSYYIPCRNCQGSGLIKSDESQSLQVMRMLQRAAAREDIARIEISVTPAVAHHLGNVERKQISAIEAATGKTVVIRSNPAMGGSDVLATYLSPRGTEVAMDADAHKSPVKLETIDVNTLPGAPTQLDEAYDEDLDLEADDVTASESQSDNDAAYDSQIEEEREPREQQAEESSPPVQELEAETQPAAGSAVENRPACQIQPMEHADDGEQPKKKSRRRGRRGGRRHRRNKSQNPSGDIGEANGQHALGTAQPASSQEMTPPAT